MDVQAASQYRVRRKHCRSEPCETNIGAPDWDDEPRSSSLNGFIVDRFFGFRDDDLLAPSRPAVVRDATAAAYEGIEPVLAVCLSFQKAKASMPPHQGLQRFNLRGFDERSGL